MQLNVRYIKYIYTMCYQIYEVWLRKSGVILICLRFNYVKFKIMILKEYVLSSSYVGFC